MSDQSTAVSRVEAEGLGRTQEAALAALRTGSSFRQAAEAAGVSRPTIYRWVQSDPHFRAAYNAWMQEQAESARGRLLKLADKAVDVVEAELGRSNEKVAVQVLRNMGVIRGRREESTNPKVLKLEMEVKRLEGEYRAAEALVKHLLTQGGLTPDEQRRFIRARGVPNGENVEEISGELKRMFRIGQKVEAMAGPSAPSDETPGETTRETDKALSRESNGEAITQVSD